MKLKLEGEAARGTEERGRWMEIGRWSEPRSWQVDQVDLSAKLIGRMERSGEERVFEEAWKRVWIFGSFMVQ